MAGSGNWINMMRMVLVVLVLVVLVPFLPILISGRWDWWQAWVFALVNVLGFVVSRALAARRHADLLHERAKYLDHPNAVSWDKILSPLVGLGAALIPVAAGLDALWGNIGVFAMWQVICALVLILAGFTIGSWALIENRFFSGVVRIQIERGHYVVTSGPYRWVRHPGYAGGLLTYLATPVFLGSMWTFVPVIFIGVVLVLRTYLEDRTLQQALPGYIDYAAHTRYRLLPGIW